MSGYWSVSNRSSAGAAATATQNAPLSGAPTVIRIRSIQCSFANPTAAGADVVTISDGATVIWSRDLAAPANGYAGIDLADLDIRCSPGNAMTIAFGAGVGGAREDVNAQGDFIPVGYPMFQS